MSSIGPQLPPHLSKRKRTPDDDGPAPASPPKHPRRGTDPATKNRHEIDLDGSDDDDDVGPSAPPAVGPPLPPPANEDEIDLSDSGSDSDTGPAPPPRPQPQPARQSPPRPQPQSRPHPPPPPADAESSSDSDSDYGPSLPSATAKRAAPIGPSLPSSEPAPQRDSWMLAPPTSSGYSERDPTRMRNRKFASKPSAAPKADGGLPSIWTETPEEKLRRLQDSVLGRGDAGADGTAAATTADKKSKEDEERDRRIAASIEAQRGKSLYDEHSAKRRDGGVDKGEEEDDPSQRAFDREKDMAIGGKIGTAKRRELVTKSANFGGRFQKGSYL